MMTDVRVIRATRNTVVFRPDAAGWNPYRPIRRKSKSRNVIGLLLLLRAATLLWRSKSVAEKNHYDDVDDDDGYNGNGSKGLQNFQKEYLLIGNMRVCIRQTIR